MAKKIIVFFLTAVLLLSAVFIGGGCNQQPNTFTVTFLGGADDAQLYSGQTQQTVENSAQLQPPVFVRKGYNFDGWTSVISQINSDTVVKAMWAKYEFTVTFYANGGVDATGSTVVVKKVNSGLDIHDIAPKFVREGYVLSWDVEFSTIQTSCSINAVWQPKEYTVCFVDEYQTSLGLQDKKVSYDGLLEDLPELEDKTEDGEKLRFCNWADKDGKAFFDGSYWHYDNGSDKQFYLYPQWTQDKYVISYDLNGGYAENVSLCTSYDEGDEISINNPTKKGYDFIGWTGSGLEQPTMGLKIKAGDSGDKKFTANWQPKTYTFILDYNGGNAEGSNKANIVFGEKVGVLNVPTRANYEFIGWKYQNETTLISQDTVWQIEPEDTARTLVAQYRKIYTVKFKLKTEHKNTQLQCVLIDIGDFKSFGNNLEEIVITIKEGQTLLEKGISIMPTADPIEPSTGKPNGMLEDYYFSGDWKCKKSDRNGQEVSVIVRPDTVFSPTTFEYVGESGVVLLEPLCLRRYTSK